MSCVPTQLLMRCIRSEVFMAGIYMEEYCVTRICLDIIADLHVFNHLIITKSGY